MSTIAERPQMADAGENAGPPEWDDTQTVEIACREGKEAAPAMTHPWCPGLAVTMRIFGEFVVTHVASGMKIGGAYQRAGSAALELVEWAAIAEAVGFSWEADGPTVREAMLAAKDQPVPFPGATSTDSEGVRPLAIGEWVSMLRSTFAFEEFPWESSDESPWGKAEDLLMGLAAATTYPRGEES